MAGVFAGYLCLDAWVANQDRHDKNWAVLERADAPAPRRLAASYDHTSSLGFSEHDAGRQRCLDRPGGITRWAARGRAGQFEHDPKAKFSIPTLVEHAHAAMQVVSSGAERHWMGRLAAIDADQIEVLIARIPGLSVTTARFILELLETNRRRLIGDS